MTAPATIFVGGRFRPNPAFRLKGLNEAQRAAVRLAGKACLTRVKGGWVRCCGPLEPVVATGTVTALISRGLLERRDGDRVRLTGDGRDIFNHMTRLRKDPQ